MLDLAYRYKFADRIDLDDVQGTLRLAVLAAEGLYGAARVRMDLNYVTDEVIGVIVIDASTQVGLAVNGVFTAFLLRRLGRSAFTVARVQRVEGVA